MEDKKNSLGNQEPTAEDRSLRAKIFNYFYNILKDKKDINLLTTCILIALEMIQLISYLFANPHKEVWKINDDNINNLSTITGTLRIAPLMKYVNFDVYIIIFYIIIVFIFALLIFIIMQIQFSNPNSKIYRIGISFIRHFITPLTVFLVIPITEMILLPLKCVDNKVDIVKNGVECWEGLHYLYVVLGLVGAFLFLLTNFFLITFYFSPFTYRNCTTKVNSSSDTFLLFMKFIIVFRFLLISNEYVSIVITLIFSLYNLISQYSEPAYNNMAIEIVISIRNAVVFWSYLILLLAKFAYNSSIDGIIYLLIFGYPIVIYFAIVYYKKVDGNFNYTSANFNNIQEYLNKTYYLIKLVDSFLEGGKNIRYNRETENQKNDILLKGIIKIHEESCITEDCPLKKFEANIGNFNVQKICLLNYMNNYFNLGMKKFPQSRQLLIAIIQFNYTKKYNLNSVRTNLTKLQKMPNSIKEQYIIFSMDADIKKIKNKVSDANDGNEMEQEIDLLDQKYKRLKYLVENTTKLYGEFWGIFATNVTNNLNMTKLYSLGEKLNRYLNEINMLWENELKTKKIDLEHQSIAQLYSRFLKEILWNKKRSEEIQKKLNDEHHHHHEAKKVADEGPHLSNLEFLLESQDLALFAQSDEKGRCSIVQCANSVTAILGFQKHDLVGKPVEALMPSICSDGHAKMLEGRIRRMHLQANSQKDSFRNGEKKSTFILPKSKMGYLIPLNAKFTIYDDNDFSNTYIIKAKMEPKDTKSVYAYYVLTKPDFSVDSISSSALNLGLSMDLLKKYVVKMSVLVREDVNEPLNLQERVQEFEEEQKIITWVYPYIIYPKNDSQRNREDDLNNLISSSPKKQFLLQITSISYDGNLLGYAFKFTEPNQKRGLNNLNPNDFRPNGNNEILFDVLSLNYIRTVVVEKKSGLRNLRDNEKPSGPETERSRKSAQGGRRKRRTENAGEDQGGSSEEDERREEVTLSKERLLELQTRDANEVKSFIFSLPFHGNDVSLEKHRPNKEKYPVGKVQEPLIKIEISHFIKKIEDRIKTNPSLMKRLQQNNQNKTGTSQSISTSQSSISSISTNESSTKSAEELSREFSSDTSTSLANIFNAKSITYVRLMSLIIFLVVLGVLTVEFILTYTSLVSMKDRIGYLDKGYILLNNMVYSKFFVSEAVIANEFNRDRGTNYIGFEEGQTLEDFISDIKNELSQLRQEFADTYSCYSNASVTFSDEFQNFTENEQVTFKTKSNKVETTETQPFSTTMNKIPTNLFYISTVSDVTMNIDMDDRNTYELMHNLLNAFFLPWRHVVNLLVNDVKENTKNSNICVFIFALSFVLSIAWLIIFYRVLMMFIADREKPINLFLTIKKKIFEDLKNSSEAFSNKLLNKFFGNEDNEEESQQDYQANIKPTDINIIKFKAPNEYKSSVHKDKSHLVNYLKLVGFFVVFEAYMIFKFCYSITTINNIKKFTDVYSVTQYSQTDVILNVDIIKSYLYNAKSVETDSIDILGKRGTEKTEEFYRAFYDISNNFEKVLIETSRTESFLKGEYKDLLHEYVNSDFSKLVNDTLLKEKDLYKNGVKTVLFRQFEVLRYLVIQRITTKDEKDKNETLSNLLNSTEWHEINYNLKNVLRYWFKGIINILNEKLKNFVDTVKLVYISVYICLAALIILSYCIVWRSYEEELKRLLKMSFDLINLIPEEIKYMIVTKLNE